MMVRSVLLTFLVPVALTQVSPRPLAAAPPADGMIRDTVCSQPGFPGSTKIPADSLEVANDCEVASAGTIIHAVWWGGYIDWLPGDPDFTVFDVTFYGDILSAPGAAIVTYPSVVPDTTSMGLCDDGWPCFRYDLDVAVPVSAGRFWFGVRAHPIEPGRRYPPKWGRLGDEVFMGFQSMWGPSGTGPWTPVPGVPMWDASQQFEVWEPTPVRQTTWGVLRHLFH